MKKLSKKEFEEFLDLITIDFSQDVFPFLGNFCERQKKEGFSKSTLYDYFLFLKHTQITYRELNKFGNKNYQEHLDWLYPVPEVQDEEEEEELPVVDAKEVIARSVRKFAEWLSEAYDENSAFTLDEILAEIGVFINSLDKEADND